MAWTAIQTQPRLTQCFVYTVAALNDCGIYPCSPGSTAGAEIKPWLREQLYKIEPPVTPEEVDTVLVGLVHEGAQFEVKRGLEAFMEHPLFGKRGHKLG